MKRNRPQPGRTDSARTGLGAVGLVALASVALIVVDAQAGSPVQYARTAVGSVVGPVESVAAEAVRPFNEVATSVRTNSKLRSDVAALQEQNSKLRSELASNPVNQNKVAQYDGLVRTAKETGYRLVPARVIAMGPAQSFTRSVTINAGKSSGIRPDATVVNADGLVGRVISATNSTATVLLIVDADSVVGGRLGANLKIGAVRGNGGIGGDANLSLELVDTAATPTEGDSVVTWGSSRGGPYVAGIPIGRVESVTSSPRDLSKTAIVKPFVDFSALDLVGVVVAKGTTSDRPLVRADGSIR